MKRCQTVVGSGPVRWSCRRTVTASQLAVAAIAAAAGVWGPAARGTVYVYDPLLTSGAGSDGAGVWDTTTPNWYNTASGAAIPQAWSNSFADTAVFGVGGNVGTGLVAVSPVTGVNVGTLQFNTVIGSYNLTGGTITLGGAATISLNATSGSLTPVISAVIAGTAPTTGLLVTGNNTQANATGQSVLTLGGLNTYTGVTNISGGVTLSVSTLANGGTASNIGASSNASSNLILNSTGGNKNSPTFLNAGAQLLYTGGTATTDRGLTLTGVSNDTFNVSNAATVLTFAGQVLSVPVAGNSYRLFKQGPGAIAFTFPGTNTFSNGDRAIINSGTFILGAPGQINIFSGGDLIVGNALEPAGASAANPNVAAFNQTGGLVAITGAFGLGNTGSANQLLVGNITGGVMNASAGVYTSYNTIASTTALLNLSGGTINASGPYEGVKYQASGNAGTSVLSISAGAFNVSSTTASYVVQSGTGATAGTAVGVVNQSGGTFTLGGSTAGGTLNITRDAGSIGTYNLSGGTLTAVAIAGGAGTSTFNFNGGLLQANASGGTLMSGLTTANVLTGGARIDTQANTTTVSQALLTGAVADGGLTKTGAGTLILSGANTFNGPTTVSNGILQVGAGGTTGTLNNSSGISLASGTTLALNLSNGLNLTGPAISGGGGLVIAHNNVSNVLANTTLNPANSYTGPTNVTGGSTLTVSTLPNGGIPSAIGASSNASGNLLLIGTTGTQNQYPISGVALVYNGSTATTDRGITFGGIVQNTINVSNASTVLTIAGQTLTLPTAGTFRFYKQGAGTLAFTNPGPNSFNSGAFFLVDAGTFQLGAPGQVNNIANGVVIGNQLLTPGSTPVFNVIDGITNVNGPLAFSNSAPNNGQLLTANITGGVLNVTGVQTIVSANNNSVLNVSGGAVINDTGNLAGTGVAGATSTINISGTSTFNNTGGAVSYLVGDGGNVATVNQTGGTARFTAGLQVTGSGNTSVQTGTYNLSGGTLATLTLTGNATNASSSSTVNFNGGTLQAVNYSTGFVAGLTTARVLSTSTIDTQAFNVSTGQAFANGSSGAGLVKTGTGTLALTGISTYLGGTTVNGGTLNLSNGGAAGAVRGPLTVNTGTTARATVNDALGFNTGTSVTTLTVNAGGVFDLNASSGGVNTAGNQGFVTNLVLNGGTVTPSAGTANASNGGRFNFGPGYGITTGGNAATSTIASGVQVRGLNTVLPIDTASGATSGVDLLISGPISDFGQTGSVAKLGAGTLVVTGTNVYTGGTNVSAGTVRANSATTALGTGTTTIATGATLGGNGSTGGAVVVNGTITAGTSSTSTGNLSTGTETWNAGGTYLSKFAADNSSNDRLVLSGLTVSGSPFFVNVQGATLANAPGGATYVLAVDTGVSFGTTPDPFSVAALTLQLNGSATDATTAGYYLTEQADTTGLGGVDLVLVAAPEPTSLLLLSVAATPLVLGRRRRSGRP